jgi:HD-GYP domain-containing protein (c-di-GMP phosphodiesterase class II)
MTRMRRSLGLYIWGITMAGIAAVVAAVLVHPPVIDRHDVVMSAALLGLYVVTYLAPVKLAPKRTAYTYVVVQTIAMLTLAPSEAALLCALGTALGNLCLRRPWFNTAFNAGQIALTIVCAGAVYRLIAPVSLAAPDRTLASAVALLPAGALLYAVSALAVDGAAAIQRRCSPFANWATVRGPTVVPHAILVIVGAVGAMTVERAPWTLVLMIVPIAGVRSMLQAAIQFDAETVSIAEEIADAVDAQHPYLVERSRRVAEVARQIARAYRLSDEECRRVCLAARLHDVAAAAAPPRAAVDSDVLNDDQRTYLYGHAEEGAMYVAKVLGLPGVAEIIRFHHERFDGRGYPRAIVGQDIPLESRILAVADAWVALTSARDYRPALSERQALTVLRAGAGTKWDPKLPDVLASILEEVSRPAVAFLHDGKSPVAVMMRAAA